MSVTGTASNWTVGAADTLVLSEPIESLDSLLANTETECANQIAQVEIVIAEVRTPQGVLLRRDHPLCLRASRSEGCYVAEVPELEMPIAAYSHGELADAFTDLVGVLWEEYALEDDTKLTEQGLALKRRLRSRYVVAT